MRKVTRGCWLGYQHFMFMMHGKMDVNDSDLTSCLETGVGIVIHATLDVMSRA